MIINKFEGQVKWPKNMSNVFKNFLQGLLCKDPNKRLSWPQLAEHEFVRQGVKCTLKKINQI